MREKRENGPTFGVWRREMGVRCGEGDDLPPSFNFNHNTRRHNAVTCVIAPVSGTHSGARRLPGCSLKESLKGPIK